MRSTTPGADWFIRALVRRFAELGPREFSILWVDVPTRGEGAPPFVRVSHGGNQLLLEVAANHFLDDACQLSAADEIRLLEFGFHPPVGGLPDFWLVCAPDDIGRCAALAATVLTEILRIDDARLVSYDGGPVDDVTTSAILPAPVSLLHHEGTLTVWIDYDAAGDLEITGHDLGGPARTGMRSYLLTVPAADFPLLRSALNAPPDVDVRALLSAYGPLVVHTGERRWLDAHAIRYDAHDPVGH